MKKSHGRLFVMMYHDVMDTPAWRAMSHGARNLYFALKRNYNAKQNNNGRIFLSVRDASLLIGANKDLVAHWFRELQHFGFIVMTRPGGLGADGKGLSPHWRLTELDTLDAPATTDFRSWDGTLCKPRKQRRPAWPSNGGPPMKTTAPKKQNPVLHGTDTLSCTERT